MTEEKNDKWLEVSEVASRLRCSIDSVYRHRASPESLLVFIKSGPKKGYRVLESSVLKLIEYQQNEEIY